MGGKKKSLSVFVCVQSIASLAEAISFSEKAAVKSNKTFFCEQTLFVEQEVTPFLSVTGKSSCGSSVRLWHCQRSPF